jgi:hypothetical protein
VLNTGQDRKLAKIQSHIFRKISTSLESRPLYDHDAIVFEQIRWVLGALDVGQDFRKYKNNNNNNKRKSARANFSEQRNNLIYSSPWVREAAYLHLASPIFQELGPDARALLEVVASFPKVSTKTASSVVPDHLQWVQYLRQVLRSFSDVLERLVHHDARTITRSSRSHGSKSPPLLCTTKEQYFARMSVSLNPNKPGFGESRCITPEDVNVEHLYVFAKIDMNSENVWDACTNFMRHLARHKNWLTILGPKIEGLPDDHPSKPRCLSELSRLFRLVGNNHAKRERLLAHTLKLQRERGDDRGVARTLRHISRANRHTGPNKEGVQLVEEA